MSVCLLAAAQLELLKPVLWSLVAISGLLGLIAVISPRCFRILATQGSQWVDTNRLLACLDKRFDIDCYVLPHARLLGAVVLASLAILAIRWFGR
ncbi:MAG: hypothetical protein WD403_10950 [Pirellulales bacterium]